MISVCIATYNGENYIRQQIESIIPQLSNNDEIIISDDGSTDNTVNIIKNINDKRIRIFNNHNTHGVNGNFENALRNARGNYIFLSDQDDVWLGGKIEVCMSALQLADCVIHDAIITDAKLNIISDSFFSYQHSGRGILKNLYKNTYLGCCMAFRSELLKTILPIPNTTRFYHDNWIGLIADWKYKLKYIPFKGILFRRHEQNTSSTASSSRYSLMTRFSNRLIHLYLTYIRIKTL